MLDVQLTSAQYAARGQTHCPVCGSVLLVYGRYTLMDDKSVNQYVRCSSCRSDWYDCFILTGYASLENRSKEATNG